MNGSRIRPAGERDLERIVDLGLAVNLLHHQHWPQLFRGADARTAQEAYWLRCLRAPGALCLIAECDDQFAGMLIGQVVDEAEGALLQARRLFRVATVAVVEAHRRRGVASALMGDAMRIAAAAGAQELRLNAWEFNQAALAFYTKLGLATRIRTLALDLPPAASQGANE